MAPVSHGTSACASSAFAPPTTNKIGAMGAKGAMVPAYFSMTAILRSLHWLRVTERIEYRLLSLTYKVLTTIQPPYLHNLISIHS